VQEWEALGRAAEKLTTTTSVMSLGQWKGTHVVAPLLSDVYETVAGIYNRVERVMVGLPPAESSETPQAASKEGAPSGSSSEPSGVVPVKAVA
jgi:hypothetical protein